MIFNNNGGNKLDKSDDEDEAFSNGESIIALLVNLATCKNASPAGVKKILSFLSKKAPPDEELSISIRKVKSKKDSNSKEEIAVTGKTRQLVNNTITFFFFKHSRSHAELLVNKGANRGVVGEDARVFFTNPSRKVSICDINNYKRFNLTVTADRVTKTASREAIVILN